MVYISGNGCFSNNVIVSLWEECFMMETNRLLKMVVGDGRVPCMYLLHLRPPPRRQGGERRRLLNKFCSCQFSSWASSVEKCDGGIFHHVHSFEYLNVYYVCPLSIIANLSCQTLVLWHTYDISLEKGYLPTTLSQYRTYLGTSFDSR